MTSKHSFAAIQVCIITKDKAQCLFSKCRKLVHFHQTASSEKLNLEYNLSMISITIVELNYIPLKECMYLLRLKKKFLVKVLR